MSLRQSRTSVCDFHLSDCQLTFLSLCRLSFTFSSLCLLHTFICLMMTQTLNVGSICFHAPALIHFYSHLLIMRNSLSFSLPSSSPMEEKVVSLTRIMMMMSVCLSSYNCLNCTDVDCRLQHEGRGESASWSVWTNLARLWFLSPASLVTHFFTQLMHERKREWKENLQGEWEEWRKKKTFCLL